MHHRSTSLRPGWRYCKAFVIVNQLIFNSTTHTCTHTHLKKTTLLFYILSDFTTNNTLSMRSSYAKIISLLMLGIIWKEEEGRYWRCPSTTVDASCSVPQTTGRGQSFLIILNMAAVCGWHVLGGAARTAEVCMKFVVESVGGVVVGCSVSAVLCWRSGCSNIIALCGTIIWEMWCSRQPLSNGSVFRWRRCRCHQTRKIAAFQAF